MTTEHAKSLWSTNPIPYGCVFYLPLWALKTPVAKSVDRYRHTCTGSGTNLDKVAKGWSFGGADEVINCGSPAALDNLFDGGGTIIAWINPDSDGELDQGRIWDKTKSLFYVSNEAGGKVRLKHYQYFSGTDLTTVTNATCATIGSWTHVAVTYNSDATTNVPIFYADTSVIASTPSTPTGTRDTDAASTLYIGCNSGGNIAYDGLIGLVGGWNRILTPAEITRHSNRTKRIFK